jgi:hypothetical protein
MISNLYITFDSDQLENSSVNKIPKRSTVDVSIHSSFYSVSEMQLKMNDGLHKLLVNYMITGKHGLVPP